MMNDNNTDNDVNNTTKAVKALSYCWLMYAFMYWTICVWVRCGLDNEITFKYEYYIWFMGLIGIFDSFDYIYNIKKKNLNHQLHGLVYLYQLIL